MFSYQKFLKRTFLGSVALAAPLMMTLGCASPGQPLPPSLHLPGLAQKVTAERDGDIVRLAWTIPATTTDKERIKGNVKAVVCLDLNPPTAPVETRKENKQRRASGAAAADCNAVMTAPAAAGVEASTELQLTPQLASGPPRMVAYRIELENADSRSAGPSLPAFVAAGSAPAAVGAVTVSAKREGALVQWAPLPTSAEMELKRTLIATVAGPVTATPAKKAGPQPFSPSQEKTPTVQVRLRAGNAGRDAGGMVDATVKDGSTYTYVAQRVLTVSFGEHTLELRSEASPAATFTFHDTFPPEAPTGLVLVPGGGFGQAPSIDLSWNANTESDVLGYNVYRREDAGAFVKLTPEPVAAPAFRDMHVEAGRQYTYRVTVADRRGNESAAGSEASEKLR